MSYQNVSSHLYRPGSSYLSSATPLTPTTFVQTQVGHNSAVQTTTISANNQVSTSNNTQPSAPPISFDYPSAPPESDTENHALHSTQFAYSYSLDHQPLHQYQTFYAYPYSQLEHPVHPHVASLSSQSSGYGSRHSSYTSTTQNQLSTDSGGYSEQFPSFNHNNVNNVFVAEQPSNKYFSEQQFQGATSNSLDTVSSVSSFDHLQGESNLLLKYRQSTESTPPTSSSSSQPPRPPQRRQSYLFDSRSSFSNQSITIQAQLEQQPEVQQEEQPEVQTQNQTAAEQEEESEIESVQHLQSANVQHLQRQSVPVISVQQIQPARLPEVEQTLCYNNLVCVGIILLSILLALFFVVGFVWQEPQKTGSNQSNLNQYVIYTFMIFFGAVGLPMGIICCLSIANRVATDYQKCTTAPNLASGEDYSHLYRFASTAVPGSAVASYAAQPYIFNYGQNWPYGQTTANISDPLIAETTAITAAAASIAAFNEQQISTLNVSGPAGTGLTDQPSGPPPAGSGGNGGEARLSNSSVSSLLLGREGSTRTRQRLIRQDAFECPPEYSHAFDGSGFHGDHPPSYELALLCPTRKSMDEPSNEASGNSSGSASAALTSKTENASKSVTDKPSSSTDEQAPPPPYDPKTMGLR